MKVFRRVYQSLVKYLEAAADFISEPEIEAFVKVLESIYRENRKAFVVGVGRSGLVGRAFTMRLMHLGFSAYVVGETVTPAARAGDLLIAISGSGRSAAVVAAAEVARSLGMKVVALTSFPDSPLAKKADLVVAIPGRTKVSHEDRWEIRQLLGLHEPLAPLGTQFEIVAQVVLDSVISELMYRLGVEEEDMKEYHANVEV
ncbi:MAG: 6-phospho-3-hexuloisomerase [Sulfolobales archaeon]|nr:6-phospho-3-hexuloisomerase [Sulfolobales archaeon]MDW8082167.1 6-phospho-3-hexuloisomerase [Sulfolobales archaeon]